MSDDFSEVILIRWFAAQETFLINVKNIVTASYFCENLLGFFMKQVKKKQLLLLFCSIMSLLSLLINVNLLINVI